MEVNDRLKIVKEFENYINSFIVMQALLGRKDFEVSYQSTHDGSINYHNFILLSGWRKFINFYLSESGGIHLTSGAIFFERQAAFFELSYRPIIVEDYSEFSKFNYLIKYNDNTERMPPGNRVIEFKFDSAEQALELLSIFDKIIYQDM